MKTHWSAVKTEMIVPSDIAVKENRLRSLQPDKVDGIAESFRDIGQLQPILVYANPKGPDAVREPYTLIAGLHRLEAAKKLGKGVLARITRDLRSAENSKLAEIAENLHRAELTALERAEHIAEWIKITDKLAQVAPVSKGGRGNESGINKASRELPGVERTEAQRAAKIASLAPEAKKVAIEVGLADNKSAMLKAAKLDPQLQSVALAKFAADKADRGGAVITPADKYFAAQETRLGPVDGLGIPMTPELRNDLKGAIASITAVERRLSGYAIPAVTNALSSAKQAVERQLAA